MTLRVVCLDPEVRNEKVPVYMHLLLAKVWTQQHLEGKIELGPHMTLLIAYASPLTVKKTGNSVNKEAKTSSKAKNIQYFVVVEPSIPDIGFQQLDSHLVSALTKQYLLLVFLSFSRYLEA